MADSGDWRVSVVGTEAPGASGRTKINRFLPGGRGGVERGRGARRQVRSDIAVRPSRRGPARPTAPSGSSAAAPGTFCTTTTSTASGRLASSGCAIWPAAANGKSVGAPRPRCAAREVKEMHSGALGSFLLCVRSFEKYCKLVCPWDCEMALKTSRKREVGCFVERRRTDLPMLVCSFQIVFRQYNIAGPV